MTDDFIYNFQYYALYIVAGAAALKVVLFFSYRSRFFTVRDFLFFSQNHIQHSSSNLKRNLKKLQNVLSFVVIIFVALYLFDRLMDYIY